MLGNILIWLGIIAVVVFLGWLTFRLWHAKRRVVKWAGAAVSGLFTVLLALMSVLMLVGMLKLYPLRSAPVPDLKVAASPEQIERGRHLASSFCAGCHSPNSELPLTGGVDMGKDFPMPLGTFVSANLTPAGSLQGWSDGEIFRAIRNGLDRDGQLLFAMIGGRGRHLSDDDIQAVIAYLRSGPAVASETPKPLDQYNPLLLMLVGAGVISEPEPTITAAIGMPPKGSTAEFGKYIVSFQDCIICHGADLSGGKPGQLAPIGPSLKALNGWTPQQFITTMRTGVTPDGHVLNRQMPWQNIGRMDDEELTALYAYITQ